MQTIQLGLSDLQATPICLGTMTLGEQVGEADSHAILDRAIARGVNFIDTAEMYPFPPRQETFTRTETIIGNWLAARPGVREKIVLASKVTGPSRGMPWVRQTPGLTAADIVASCEGSLKRLKVETIDLYQIHWPERHVAAFGELYYDPKRETCKTTIYEQLEAMKKLVRDGKIRYVGLSNETPFGVHEFVRVAEQYDVPRIATVQNPYCLTNRAVDNGLDETMHRLDVSLLAYSPLAFGALTGKYDASGFDGAGAPAGARLAQYERSRAQRWGRPEALAAARRYNSLARQHGMTPTRMALAWCYANWRVASTIIGVTSVAQLDEDIDAWGTPLPGELLQEIDRTRWEQRDPAQ
jgi:aryl-alcohol dehydrogenase-like predicted oxidoreductase